jgi:hypothetical protein
MRAGYSLDGTFFFEMIRNLPVFSSNLAVNRIGCGETSNKPSRPDSQSSFRTPD